MNQPSYPSTVRTLVRLCLVIVIAAGVMLALFLSSGRADSPLPSRVSASGAAITASQPPTETNRIVAPQFDFSDRKVGPALAYTGDTITYNVYLHNTGPTILNAALRDVLPAGTTFITPSCSYTVNANPPQPCGPLNQLWMLNLNTGDRVTTTYSVSIWGGTMSWPMVNCAILSWGSNELQLCATTLLNHFFNYLPVIYRDYTAPVPYIVLRADPLSLVVGDTATLTATAYDGEGGVIPDLPVMFYTFDPLGTGVLTPLNAQTNASGQAFSTLRSTIPGPVRVVVQGENGTSDSLFVTFRQPSSLFCAPELYALLETGPSPREVAFDLTGRRAFIAHAEGITVLDMDTFQPIAEIVTPGPAQGVGYDSTRNRIWATQGPTEMIVLDGTTYATQAILSSGLGPFSVEHNPANGHIYVTNWTAGTVSAYIAGTWPYRVDIPGFAEPAFMAINPSTNKIYVANHRPGGHIRVIDGATHSTHGIGTALIDRWGMAIDRPRNLIYATAIWQGRICVIDGATDLQVGCMDARYTDGSTVRLREAEVNSQYDHLFVVTSSADGEPSMFLLIPNASSLSATPSTPVPMYMRNYPQDGMLLDESTDRVWVTSVASGLVSVVQDGLPVCSTPWLRGMESSIELVAPQSTLPHGLLE
jgi:uncharacterized repeat protein (TIGR01451 family)